MYGVKLIYSRCKYFRNRRVCRPDVYIQINSKIYSCPRCITYLLYSSSWIDVQNRAWRNYSVCWNFQSLMIQRLLLSLWCNSKLRRLICAISIGKIKTNGLNADIIRPCFNTLKLRVTLCKKFVWQYVFEGPVVSAIFNIRWVSI